MALTEKQKYELKKVIQDLSSHKARHTELISVYIPEGYDMNKIIKDLQQEQGTATNIKDATTRKNVIDALEKMVQHLRLFKKTPEHGLAVFSGNVAAREGQQDFQVWSIEPPVPLKTRIYRCDKGFVLDLLEDMLETKEVYGLVVMDRREGDIALLKGKTIVPITKTKSNVPGKTRAGGQCVHGATLVTLDNEKQIPIKDIKHNKNMVLSLNRELKIVPVEKQGFYERNVNELLYIKLKSGKEIKLTLEHPLFTRGGWASAKDIPLGGEIAIQNKNENINLNSQQVLIQVLKSEVCWDEIIQVERLIGKFKVYDISVPNYHNFIANGLIVHNSAKRYEHLREDAAKDFYKKIGELMKNEFLENKNLKGIIVGGPGPTKYDFVDGGYITNEVKKKIIAIKDLSYTGDFGFEELVDKSQDVLAQEEIAAEKGIMGRFFELLSKKPGMVVYGEKETMEKLRIGAVGVLLLSESLNDKKTEEFEKEAKKVAAEVRIISTETREGVQLRDMGKAAAILRYETE